MDLRLPAEDRRLMLAHRGSSLLLAVGEPVFGAVLAVHGH
jgi:hypothetical protein